MPKLSDTSTQSTPGRETNCLERATNMNTENDRYTNARGILAAYASERGLTITNGQKIELGPTSYITITQRGYYGGIVFELYPGFLRHHGASGRSYPWRKVTYDRTKDFKNLDTLVQLFTKMVAEDAAARVAKVDRTDPRTIATAALKLKVDQFTKATGLSAEEVKWTSVPTFDISGRNVEG